MRPLSDVVPVALLATLLTLTASSAFAAVTWSVEVSTVSGVPVNNLTPGDSVIFDITASTDDQALGLAGSVGGYDDSFFAFNPTLSVVSDTLFNQVCLPTFGCFGGLNNQIGSTIPLQETSLPSGEVEVEYFAGVALTPAAGNGSIDPGIITGLPGDAQFRMVFDYLGYGGSTFKIGTYPEFQDGYTGTADSNAFNFEIFIPVIPEPSTALLLGAGLAALAARRENRV